ncbi:NAD(P)/FAD-dependent oxidoreductase [Micromonospora sp. NPDC048898]|uniref:NAD(P)/FAD-dependent oxidoreductase n=1 Tax=Micromonospora sp. NPDC048898 TaxID=3364260 RepID=UPI003720FB86
MAENGHGVVVGGGLGGILAACALREHVEQVTVVERDEYPPGAEPRKGVPQGRHAHILWSGGARAIDRLAPGSVAALSRAGAHLISAKADMLLHTAYGWQHRFPSDNHAITCARPLLDAVVRERALASGRITVRAGTEAVALTGDAGRVTGVRVREPGGAETELAADIVVDASGRGSRLPRWLEALGVPAPPVETVDTGLTYATRPFLRPPGAERFPLASVYADHRAGTPGRNGLVLPIEDGTWLITLSGTRGAEPAADDDAFAPFARALRDPLVADLIAVGEPLGPVRLTRSTVNRRLHADRAPAWPEGLVAVGDSVVSLNPIHGHGMSAAAQSAAALADALRDIGLKPGLARAAQQAIAAVVDTPWLLSTSQDICYPDARIDVTDPRLTVQAGRRQAFADLVAAAALRNPAVSGALTAVTTLTAPVSSLESPAFLTALRSGETRPPLSRAPLSEQEAAVLAR